MKKRTSGKFEHLRACYLGSSVFKNWDLQIPLRRCMPPFSHGWDLGWLECIFSTCTTGHGRPCAVHHGALCALVLEKTALEKQCLEFRCFAVFHYTQTGPGSFLTWPGEHQATPAATFRKKSGSCWLCSGHVWPSLPRLLHWLVPGNFVPDFVRWEAAAQQQSWSCWVILMIWWHKFKLMGLQRNTMLAFVLKLIHLRRVRSSPNHLCLSWTFQRGF